MKGVKVGHLLTCLVCGQETQVEDIPLKEIQEASNLAQTLLCDKLDWNTGIEVKYRVTRKTSTKSLKSFTH